MEEQYKAAMQAAIKLIDEGYPELAVKRMMREGYE